MKKHNDPRHQHRINLMQYLFTWEFDKKQVTEDIKSLIDNIKEVDTLIQKAAPERPLGQINKIDLAILRLATFEVIIKKDTPPKVVIDEAVELAKEYGSESSPAFINGSLGKLLELKHIDTRN